jgi:hypothetical protein
MKTRNISREFVSANILKLSMSHNGFVGGDEGHGGFVKVCLEDVSSTSMFINGERVNKIEFEFRGDTERDTLVQALSVILCELLIHTNSNE